MISVLIATRNRGPELETLFRSLQAVEAPYAGWELLVIDNGSSDGTSAILGRIAAEGELPLCPLFEPRAGKSRALNLGVPLARGDLLVFTDDDAVTAPRWLRAFERAAARHPESIGFAGRAPASGGPTPRGHGIVNYEHGDIDFEIKPFETPPLGVNFAFRRGAFERYGLFREDLGPGSPVSFAEDTEFVRRLWLGGERLRYVAGALVHHPVHMERLSRQSSLRRRFLVGRGNARMTGRRPGVPTVGGVPRHLYGEILRGAARVALSTALLRWGKDFARAQRLAYDLGLAYEFRNLPWDFDPRALVPDWRPAREGGGPIAGAHG